MLNNYVTIGLAIISLVCIYLIWENFKQSAKIRYLEASIHETIQTVQGLVNNSLSLPPLPRNENHNYHPTPINNSMSSVQNNNNKNNSNNSNNFNNNNSNNLNVNSSNAEARNTNVEKELFENDLESVTDEVENDVGTLEPLELTNELKDKINNLVFVDAEETTDNESNQENDEDEEDEEEDEEDDEEDEDEEKEKQPSSPVEIEELEDFSNEIQMENIVEQDVQAEQKTEEKEENQENQEDVKDEENIFDDHLSHLEEVKETQKESTTTSTTTEDYIKNPELLNGMSLKQLKDIAEKYNLGVRGGKEQLLTKIKRNITMTS